MSVARCPQCGAPAETWPQQVFHQCRYCRCSFQVTPQHAAPVLSPIEATRGQAVVHHRSMWLPWAMSVGVLALVVGGGAALRYLAERPHRWDGDSPLVCSGNDHVSADHVKARFKRGAAISARDNCEVECRSCDIRAPIAARASGNAHVTFIDGVIVGTEASCDVDGNGVVEALGDADVSGPVHSRELGRALGVPGEAR